MMSVAGPTAYSRNMLTSSTVEVAACVALPYVLWSICSMSTDVASTAKSAA
jgi:hypothetical protein